MLNLQAKARLRKFLPERANNSFKPIPYRDRGLGRVLYATLARIRNPATGAA